MLFYLIKHCCWCCCFFFLFHLFCHAFYRFHLKRYRHFSFQVHTIYNCYLTIVSLNIMWYVLGTKTACSCVHTHKFSAYFAFTCRLNRTQEVKLKFIFFWLRYVGVHVCLCVKNNLFLEKKLYWRSKKKIAFDHLFITNFNKC